MQYQPLPPQQQMYPPQSQQMYPPQPQYQPYPPASNMVYPQPQPQPTTIIMVSNQPQQQQQQPQQPSHQPSQQTSPEKLANPKGKITDARKEVAFRPSVTIKKKKKNECCTSCLYPEFMVYGTAGDRDIDETEHVYSIKPTKNMMCCEYEVMVNDNEGRPFIRTEREQMCFAFCCKAICCGFWNGPEYQAFIYDMPNGRPYGKETDPCECCMSGSFVHVGPDKKFWMGSDANDFCLGGDCIKYTDIWDSARKKRLGNVMRIQRFTPFCCRFCCLGSFKKWHKITFPPNATPDERAMILACATNRAGEDVRCCCPTSVSNM